MSVGLLLGVYDMVRFRGGGMVGSMGGKVLHGVSTQRV